VGEGLRHGWLDESCKKKVARKNFSQNALLLLPGSRWRPYNHAQQAVQACSRSSLMYEGKTGAGRHLARPLISSRVRLAASSLGVTEVKEKRARPRYTPGEIVPRTGIYKIYHNQHRLMHEAALIENTFFPRCRKCKNTVRFVLARPVLHNSVLPFRSTELLEEYEQVEKKSVGAG